MLTRERTLTRNVVVVTPVETATSPSILALAELASRVVAPAADPELPTGP